MPSFKYYQYLILDAVTACSYIRRDGKEKHTEGCLSVPDFQAEIQRAYHIKVEAINEKGEVFTLQATGLIAICIQYELDHLKVILFVDYLSKLKQKLLLEKTKKMIKG